MSRKPVSTAELQTYLATEWKTEELTEMLQAFRGFSVSPPLDAMEKELRRLAEETAEISEAARTEEEQLNFRMQESKSTWQSLQDALQSPSRSVQELEGREAAARLRVQLESAQNQIAHLQKETAKIHRLESALELALERLSKVHIVNLETRTENGIQLLSCRNVAGKPVVQDYCCDHLTFEDLKRMLIPAVPINVMLFCVLPSGVILDCTDHSLVKSFVGAIPN
eukprot:TRINITY_DN81807_c0_g1_i1.p1 TRINITY_DN81807_c0_g1~~TRINITY_DN81807_c0_g1_i1.p1  ORF type:complete len:225 (-),score=48.00 TRINITY_DN81807_c0_g1_i1:55-729(-)